MGRRYLVAKGNRMRARPLLIFSLTWGAVALSAPFSAGFSNIKCEVGSGAEKTMFQAQVAPFHDKIFVDARIVTGRGLHPSKHDRTLLSFNPKVSIENDKLIRIASSSGANVMLSAQEQLDAQLSLRGMADVKTPDWVETCRDQNGKYVDTACTDRSKLYEVIDGKLHADPTQVFVTNFPQLVTYSALRAEVLKGEQDAATALLTVQWSRYVEETAADGKPQLDSAGRTVYRLVDNGFTLRDVPCTLGE
jgi:hypothetical protein